MFQNERSVFVGFKCFVEIFRLTRSLMYRIQSMVDSIGIFIAFSSHPIFRWQSSCVGRTAQENIVAICIYLKRYAHDTRHVQRELHEGRDSVNTNSSIGNINKSYLFSFDISLSLAPPFLSFRFQRDSLLFMEAINCNGTCFDFFSTRKKTQRSYTINTSSC